MPADLHETSLIALLAIGFVLALLFGLVANLLRVSPIVGYLVAGIAVGPFTPGFVGDSGLANQLSEIGVILLMFGVGLHFSIKDLMSVRNIALPGAVAQIATATAIGVGMAHLMGWSLGVGLVFGLSLSVASTVVLLRALEERNALQSSEGKIAVDIGPKTIELYSKEISGAKTVIWNGPMGIFEKPPFDRGTVALAKAVAESGATSVVGGGDSEKAIKAAGVTAKISHVSTGGGASLEFLAGDKLPGVVALEQ